MWMNDSRSKVVVFGLKGIERTTVRKVERIVKTYEYFAEHIKKKVKLN